MNQIQAPYNRINQHDIFNEKMSSQPKQEENRVDVGSYPQHLSLHRTYGSRIRRYIHIGERKL